MVAGGKAVAVVLFLVMALLSFRGISTPSLPAQGEQRRHSFFNIGRGIPSSSRASGNLRRLSHWLRSATSKHLLVTVSRA
jgi:hypothetical protein